MRTSPFLDVNVWVALAHTIHPHHAAAMNWALTVDSVETFYLCRFTQLGVLRILTNRGAMGVDVLTQAEAWAVFDRLVAYWRAVLIEEPVGFEKGFRALTIRDQVSTQHWADAYLAEFASGHGLALVTFDKALVGLVAGAVLLR
jgi:toxin-antitoxin system PIN domain toxin